MRFLDIEKATGDRITRLGAVARGTGLPAPTASLPQYFLYEKRCQQQWQPCTATAKGSGCVAVKKVRRSCGPVGHRALDVGRDYEIMLHKVVYELIKNQGFNRNYLRFADLPSRN